MFYTWRNVRDVTLSEIGQSLTHTHTHTRTHTHAHTYVHTHTHAHTHTCTHARKHTHGSDPGWGTTEVREEGRLLPTRTETPALALSRAESEQQLRHEQ